MPLLTNPSQSFRASTLPSRLTAPVLNLSRTDHATLVKKRSWLQNYTVILPPRLSHDPSTATFVFAQEEAGTAVCISPNGILLTCSHCVAETQTDLAWDQVHWLLTGRGDVVGAQTIAWDGRRDLALLLITRSSPPTPYPYLAVSVKPPRSRSHLLCIGHPGTEDLETSMPGVQTNYDTLVLSTGLYHGLAEGQNPQDNSEIGALQHSCWTYWGHSGAPLVETKGGSLVGVHSSWDDRTGMRRGVGWEAVCAFLREVEEAMREVETPEGWVWWVMS